MLCRVCGIETEDNEHIWTCSKRRKTQEGLWEDALDRVDGWEEIATRLFNKQRQKQIKPGKQPPHETVWRIPRTIKLHKTLWQAIKRPGEEEEEEPEQHTPECLDSQPHLPRPGAESPS
ncbi:hypothetical protein EC957_010871 [Mortierella hygrophila]|uniref:Uncharacterized protein n=1 Tax=Mortierella hygrophila TaxID=979708 RepID=A0A9P6F9L5_9FUNG|nr:hypothetical protein EC957_010871 [Mortierella hygrophila]